MVAALYEEETIEGTKVREIIKEFEDQNSLPTHLQELEEVKTEV